MNLNLYGLTGDLQGISTEDHCNHLLEFLYLMALNTFVWCRDWAPGQHCIKKHKKSNTKELILSPITVNKGMCESLSMSETWPVFAGPGSFFFFPIFQMSSYWKAQQLSSEQVGWGLPVLPSLSAARSCSSRNWCCCIKAKIPVFPKSKALEACCAGQIHSWEDCLQKRMKEPFWGKKEPAVCTKTVSTVWSCDRWELTPFCQVNSKSYVYFSSFSRA